MDVARDVESGDRAAAAAASAHETVDAAASQAAATVTRDGRMPPTAARVLAMQRLAGNRAASAALRAGRPKAAVQRAAADTAEQLGAVPATDVEEEQARPAEATTEKAAAAGAAATDGGDADGGGAGDAGAGAGSAAGSGAPSGDPAALPVDAVVKKAAEARPAAEASKAAGDVTKAAGDVTKAAGDVTKAAGDVAKAGVAPSPPKKSAPVIDAKPLPDTAKRAPAVKAAPAPPQPKKQPAKVVPAGVKKQYFQPVAPPVPVSGEPAPSAAPAIEEKTVQSQAIAVQRDGGGGGGGGGGGSWNGDMNAPVWDSWTMDELFSGARTALEVSRFVPGWGLLGGGVADVLGAVQDLESIPPGEYPITEGLVWLRSVVNVMNNATGHIMYVGELIQDGLAGSVIGAEFVPVSAAAMETAAGLKVFLDGVLFYADLGVEIGALWNQSHSGPEQWEQWQGVIDGYQANLLGDIVGTIFDVITLATAGATNVDVLKAGSGIFNTAGLLAQNWGRTLITFLQSMFNVWGAKTPWIVSGEQVPIGVRPPAQGEGPNAPRRSTGVGDVAEAALMRAGGGWLQLQAAQGRVAWEAVDAGIGVLQEEGARRMAELDAVVMAISGGKNLWQVLQEGMLAGLGHMREKAASLQELTTMASDGERNGEEVKGWAKDLLDKIDAFTVPNVRIPDVEIGDDLLSEIAEGVAGGAAAIANAALEAIVEQVRTAVDDVKAELRSPVQAVYDKAVEIGEFLALVARVSGEQIATIDGYIAQFESGLAQCNGFEDAIDLIIRQITGMMGVQPFTIDDIRQYWRSLPQYFDSLNSLGARLIAGAAVIEQGTPVQTMPEVMAAPASSDDDENAAAGNSTKA